MTRKTLKRFGTACLLLAVLLLSACGGKAQPEPEEEETEVPETLYADITVRDYGTITIRLEPETAPVTVENFVSLAESGFYDGLTFHRIMSGFMIQGGDPEGNGTGGAENSITGEFAQNGFDNSLSHTRGTVSMARTAVDYNSASSQFFIVQQDSAFLDGGYAAFGTVTEGMEVVDAICDDAVPLDNNGTIAPEEQPVITSIVIRHESAEPDSAA